MVGDLLKGTFITIFEVNFMTKTTAFELKYKIE